MKSISKATLTAILTLFVALAVPAMAQNKRIPICVEATNNDSIGRAVTYALKEGIAHSGVFQNTTDETFTLHLVSASIDDDDIAHNKVSAIAMTLRFAHEKGSVWVLDQRIYVVGRDKVEDMARTILTDVSSDVDEMNRLTKDDAVKPKSY